MYLGITVTFQASYLPLIHRMPNNTEGIFPLDHQKLAAKSPA